MMEKWIMMGKESRACPNLGTILILEIMFNIPIPDLSVFRCVRTL